MLPFEPVCGFATRRWEVAEPSLSHFVPSEQSLYSAHSAITLPKDNIRCCFFATHLQNRC